MDVHAAADDKIHILIVDDETDVRELVVEILQEAGYTTDQADSGATALLKIEQTRYDLIVTDLVMPGMDGIELTNRIRELAIMVPIVVVTGFATVERAVECMKAGAMDLITKPFNRGQILITVEKVLAQVRLRHEREFYKNLSNSDELTGVANYRAFNKMLRTEVDRALRYSRPLALMMIDIDDFKRCNDTFGHLAGDMVLRQIARLISDGIRGSDFLARYGGEEFCVILPEADTREAYAVAERIREAIATHPFISHDGTSLPQQTVSIGISAIPEMAAEGEELVRTADFALYRGKTAGKNRVELYT